MRCLLALSAALLAGCAGGTPASAAQRPAHWEPASAKPLKVPVVVQNATGLVRAAEPVTIGVPLARESSVHSTEDLQVVDRSGNTVPAQFRVLSRWGPLDDKNAPLRWVLVDFQGDAPGGGTATYFLHERPGSSAVQAVPPSSGIVAKDGTDAVTVDTGAMKILVPKKGGYLFETAIDGRTYRTRGFRIVKGDRLFESASAAPGSVVLEESGALRAVVRMRGTFQAADGSPFVGGDGRAAPDPKLGKPVSENKPLQYTVRLTAYSGKPYVRVAATLENNGSGSFTGAWYPSNDVFFDGLYLDLQVPVASPVTVDGGAFAERLEGEESFALLQQHEVHAEYDEGQNFAYQVTVSGRSRATKGRFPGLLTILDQERGLTVAVKRFWQNYPKSLEFRKGVLSVGLWPQDGGKVEVGHYGKGRYFFSGGWQKTHEIALWFHRRDSAKAREEAERWLAPLVAGVPPAWHAQSKAWGLIAPSGWVPADADAREALDRYERYQRILVDREASHDGIDLETIRERRGYLNWFSCDWYGWEDFGDLMHGGKPCQPSSLIYDWPYIMWLQFIRSGDARFRELAEEMTDHSRDLDQHHNEDAAGNPVPFGNIVDGVWTWETGKFRGHHMNFNGAGNIISHTWNGGYALGYLLTGDPSYLNAARHGAEAGRRYWSKAIRGDKVSFDQTRSQGWSILMLVNLYKITGETSLLKDALAIFTNSLLYTEQLPAVPGSGGQGYISIAQYADKQYIGKVVATFATYHLEPLVELHWEASQAGLPVTELEQFLLRAVNWLKDHAYVGGKRTESGRYVPLTLSYSTDPLNPTANRGGTIGMNTFVAGAAAYAYLILSEREPERAQHYLAFARQLFRDVMYYKEVPKDKNDGSVEPGARSRIWWSNWPLTAPKELGWIGRGGQCYLHVEHQIAGGMPPDGHTAKPSPLP